MSARKNDLIAKASRVYQDLRDGIIEGRLAPRTRLCERDLAAKLGVSRTPVREALHRLEREGHVRLIPRVGAEVNEVSLRDLFELFDLRRCLEVHAACLAAARLTPAAEEDLREMRKTFKEAGKLDAVPVDLRPHIAADRRLHQFILDVAGNRQIARVMSNLMDTIQGYRHLAMPYRFRRTAREHLDIIKALLARDPAEVGAAMERHLDRSVEDLQRLLLGRLSPDLLPANPRGAAPRRGVSAARKSSSSEEIHHVHS